MYGRVSLAHLSDKFLKRRSVFQLTQSNYFPGLHLRLIFFFFNGLTAV